MSTPNEQKDHNDKSLGNYTERKTAVDNRKRSLRNAMKVVPVVLTTERSKGFVCVVLDGFLTSGMQIEVMEGDNVISIKYKIKEKGKNSFALVDADELILYESEGTTELEAERQ